MEEFRIVARTERIRTVAWAVAAVIATCLLYRVAMAAIAAKCL